MNTRSLRLGSFLSLLAFGTIALFACEDSESPSASSHAAGGNAGAGASGQAGTSGSSQGGSSSGASGTSGVSGSGTGGSAAAPQDGGIPDAMGDGDAPDASVIHPDPGLVFIDKERGVELTPDGLRALVWQQSTGELFFYDTVTKSIELKTTLDLTELQNQQPHALSANGRIAAGYGFNPGAPAVWAESSGWTTLESPLPGCVDNSGPTPLVTEKGAAFDLSDDGKIAVGLLWNSCSDGQAFLWDESASPSSMILLEKVGAQGFERATAVSADGKMAGGFAPLQGPSFLIDRAPALWKHDGTGFLIDPSNGEEPGEVKAISTDGSVVSGDWSVVTGGQTGFIWTEQSGVQRFSVDSETPEFVSIYVNAMNGDGTRVFGTVSTFDPNLLSSTQSAFMWTQDGGVVSLESVAAANNITIEAGTHLSNAISVSRDGMVILGEATVDPAPDDPTGFPSSKVFLLVLPTTPN